MSHYVYILKSLKDDRYYIGESSNVKERLAFHNAGRQRSTKSRIPFILIATEEYEDRVAAWRGRNKLNPGKGEKHSQNW